MAVSKVPKHLSRSSKALYRKLVADYDLGAEPHALRVLTLTCEAVDRAEQARQRIATDGAYLPDRHGTLRAHPAIAVERDSRISAYRGLRELSLDSETVGEARPPRISRGRT